MMDMGLLTDERALTSICARLPQRLHEAASLCLEQWHEYCMWTYSEMGPVIRALRAGVWDLSVFQCGDSSVGLLSEGNSGMGLF